jgi:hypothetical protein
MKLAPNAQWDATWGLRWGLNFEAECASLDFIYYFLFLEKRPHT